MSQPLALVLYEKLMPGSQLVNRLQDLNYRVQAVTDAAQLTAIAESEKPLVIFADLDLSGVDVCGAITSLRHNQTTAHIPVVAYFDDNTNDLVKAAQNAGATLTVTDAAVLTHLPQLLERALQVE